MGKQDYLYTILTLSILEIAEAFMKAKADGYAPKRSILFLNVTGEEKGLIGSKWYTDNPVFPLANTVANLNIDMIGRIGTGKEEAGDYVYLIGSDKLSTELHNLSEEVNAKYFNMELAANAHSQKGAYLEIFKDEGAQGFNPSDYQIQLTRRVRGMPLWFSLAMHGTEKYRKAIERGIELARIAAEKIKERPYLELVRPASLSVVLFRRKDWAPDNYRDWTYKNHREGIALVTPTKWKTNSQYETISRFCFINPDTTEADIDMILDTMA